MRDFTHRVVVLLSQWVLNKGQYITAKQVGKAIEIVLRDYNVTEKKRRK